MEHTKTKRKMNNKGKTIPPKRKKIQEMSVRGRMTCE